MQNFVGTLSYACYTLAIYSPNVVFVCMRFSLIQVRLEQRRQSARLTSLKAAMSAHARLVPVQPIVTVRQQCAMAFLVRK